MGGSREEGFGGVGGEELGAEFGEVDFLRVGGAFGVCCRALEGGFIGGNGS